eukprot:COSAG01_NODE_29512_length_635_cov_14.744403_2_plen_75_part_00
MRTVSFSHSLSAVGSQPSNAIACTAHAHEPRRTRCVDELAMYKSSLSMRATVSGPYLVRVSSISISIGIGNTYS